MATTSFLRNLAIVLAVGGIRKAASEVDCFDLAPYAINPEFLSILTGGGDIPSNTAVYFEFPSTFVEGGVLYCLKDIAIPNTVGNKPCGDSEECWLAVGNRASREMRGVSAAQYGCLCSGTDMKNPSTLSTTENVSDVCGLQNEDSWGVSCHDATNGQAYLSNDEGSSATASKFASAYISICSAVSSNCGVCQDGGGLHPSFVVGIQWVSNLQDQCMSNPFASYVDYCSTGLTVASIVGIAIGGVLFIAAVGGLCHYYRVVRVKKGGDLCERKYPDVEGQRNHPKSDVPPVEEISITTDGSPVE